MPTEIAGVDDAPAAEHDENNAEARLQALNDCVETISHEIRTPLSSILLNADRIQRTTEETTSSDSAIRIKRGVQRISEIVTRILFSAQIEQFGIVL
jgi:signal transduction histidine kinase